MQPTLTSAMGGFTSRKDELAECAHNARSPQVTAEVARMNEITAAQLGALIHVPDAVDFVKRSVEAIAQRLASYSEPSQP